MRRTARPRLRTLSPPLILLLAAVLSVAWLVGLPVRAAADGPTTFSNTTSIAIPGIGDVAPRSGPASPYPSNITVSGMAGLVTNVTVTLNRVNTVHGLAFGSLNDFDVMVVAPTGQNLIVLSDIGGDSGAWADNATLTLADSAPSSVPAGNVVTGTYRPTNNAGGTDTFPAAPTPSSQTTLAAFNGIEPTGTWRLFAVDDAEGDYGEILGGWSLTITTASTAVATATTLSSSDTTTFVGDDVTFTARVFAGTTPATGDVEFRDESTNTTLGTRPLSNGVTTLTTSALAEGTHAIRATYLGDQDFLGSQNEPPLSQRVDNATVVTGTTFCNPGAITGPTFSSGAGNPYPSNIFVTGLAGQVTKVTASLRGLSHSAPIDFDLLLSGPTPTRNVILLSDAGGQNPVNNLTVNFDDAAAGAVPNPAVSDTFRPTDLDPDSQVDTFVSPAPALSGATALSTFNGASANGTWSLWVIDDATGDDGSISGGWCLTITSQVATDTALTATPNPSTFGQQVTFTATVTDDGDDPVTEGTVQFRDGATALGTPVAVDDDGVATFTTSTLSVGTHPITATYSGTANLAESADSLDQVVNRAATATALTSSVYPSDVGESVTFTATVTDADGDPLTTGSVQFDDDGAALGPPVPVGAGGTATFTTSSLTAGTHPITATFIETAQYAESSDDLDQVVARIVTETALTSDNTPSDVGESVTFTATVTDADGDPLTTGSVQFDDDGTALGPPVPVGAGGTATFTTSTLTAGTHPITATFIETAQFAESSDDLDQVVARIVTETALTSSVNPSLVGQSVTFTATVTAGGAPVTSGTVQFMDGTTELGTPVAVGADGIAVLTTSTLPAGTYQITAVFAQTAQYAGSTSDPVVQIVGLVPTATELASDPNPSDVGEDVTFTATVTAGGSPVTSGTVQFRDGTTALGPPVPVNASGVAALSTADLAAGTHLITATFIETAQYVESTSPTVDQVVNRIGTATALVSSVNPSEVGQEVTFTATVTRTEGGAAVTSGSVEFRDGATVLDSVDLDPLGQATFATDDLDAGSHPITAVFLETAQFGESTSDRVDQVVRPPAADAGGPYEIDEGESLTLDGSGSIAGVTYGWDLNGDDDFTDATGATPTLTWAQLEALGIDDGLVPPATQTIRLVATLGGVDSEPADAQLTVTNTGPASVLTGDLTATVGVPFTIKVGADDPSSADTDAQFTYLVNWGDGSPVISVPGPADPPVTHVYVAAGRYNATFTATDKDGGRGPVTQVIIVAQQAQIASPTPTPTDDGGGDYDGGDYDSDDTYDSDNLASTGSTVGLGTLAAALLLLGIGAGLVIVGRRRSGRRQG